MIFIFWKTFILGAGATPSWHSHTSIVATAKQSENRGVKSVFQIKGEKVSWFVATPSTHSFRKGVAHEAALVGVQDSIIKTMGG